LFSSRTEKVTSKIELLRAQAILLESIPFYSEEQIKYVQDYIDSEVKELETIKNKTKSTNISNSVRPKTRKRRIPSSSIEQKCVKCSTTDSSTWRSGPMGKRTLCNRCGLRWAKENKEEREVKKKMSFKTLVIGY